MASRPPEDDDAARSRWTVIQIVRASGAIMAILGRLTIEGIVPIPEVAGYGFLAAGLVEVFLLPTLLARKWSSREP